MKFRADEFVKMATGLRSQAVTIATVNGTGIDRRGFEEALVAADVGDLAATAPLDVKVQESDVVGSGYVDVASAAFAQFVNTTNENKLVVGRLDLSKRKRFIRIVATAAGSAPTGSFCVMVALLAANVHKVTQEVAVGFNV